MSLRARFLLLLTLLGVAVVANLAISVWSVGLLDREQRWANEQIGSVLGPLHVINREVWDEAKLLGSPGFGVFDAMGTEPSAPSSAADAQSRIAQIQRHTATAIEQVDALERFPAHAVRAGVSTTKNLRDRLTLAGQAAETWVQSGDERDRLRALRMLYELHELAERIEARLVQDAALAADYGQEVRPRLVLTVLTSVSMVALLLFVAASCFRRWVLVKAERLRVAAEHLGRGEFEHRVPVDGDDELDRVGRQVNEMASTIETMQAERIERERLAAIGEMTRRVAHNIRNPLAGIRSLAELTLADAEPDSPVVEHQRRIMKTVDRFGSWLTELLSVSAPMELMPRMEPVGPWLEGLIEAHRPMAEDRKVHLVLDASHAPKQAPIDRRHLEHAVSAVVSNAIECSPAGSRVDVRAAAAGQSWEITVADQGPGISPDVHRQLFRPYFTTKAGGTGIGLAIAHRVVRDHGGRITAESRLSPAENGNPHAGSVFRIVLPLATGQELATIGQEDEANFGQRVDH